VFRVTGDAVRAFVMVTDRDDRIVTTLTECDFEVRDDGGPQPITLFDNSPQFIRLVVMLDVSGTMQGNLPLLRAAADELVARLLPDDLARVGTFGETITVSPEFTRGAYIRWLACAYRIANSRIRWLVAPSAMASSVARSTSQ
jgi:hypothetical protein